MTRTGPQSRTLERASGLARAAMTAWRQRRPWAQLVIFAGVGVANTSLSAAVFTLLVVVAGWSDQPFATAASVTGFLAGAVNSYAWNSRVTFGLGGHRDSAGLLGKFLAVVLSGTAISAGVFSAVHAGWPLERSSLAAAELTVIAVAAAWNFLLMRQWVFAFPPLAQVE